MVPGILKLLICHGLPLTVFQTTIGKLLLLHVASEVVLWLSNNSPKFQRGTNMAQLPIPKLKQTLSWFL